jgi:glutaredoxin
MEKVHRVIMIFFIAAVIVIASLFAVYMNLTGKVIENPVNENVLYYGSTCSHCKIIEEFINSNNITEKLKFEQKEVFENKENANELTKVAEYCKLDSSNIGVPFMYYEGECYIGDIDIIKLLKEKANIS